jgi:hypothetical protein
MNCGKKGAHCSMMITSMPGLDCLAAYFVLLAHTALGAHLLPFKTAVLNGHLHEKTCVS